MPVLTFSQRAFTSHAFALIRQYRKFIHAGAEAARNVFFDVGEHRRGPCRLISRRVTAVCNPDCVAQCVQVDAIYLTARLFIASAVEMRVVAGCSGASTSGRVREAPTFTSFREPTGPSKTPQLDRSRQLNSEGLEARAQAEL